MASRWSRKEILRIPDRLQPARKQIAEIEAERDEVADKGATTAIADTVAGSDEQVAARIATLNLATHKSNTAAQLLKSHGCRFLFLPACSPDLNPIEMAFSKLKAHLRRTGARTFDQLIEAIDSSRICYFCLFWLKSLILIVVFRPG